MADRATRTRERLLARVLRDLVRTERFEHPADVKEALKARCAQLHIPYDAAIVGRACDIVGLHERPRTRVRPPDRAPVFWRVTREEAAQVWAQWTKGIR